MNPATAFSLLATAALDGAPHDDRLGLLDAITAVANGCGLRDEARQYRRLAKSARRAEKAQARFETLLREAQGKDHA